MHQTFKFASKYICLFANMPGNVSPIPKYVDVKCFPLRLELQDTTWGARVSGATADPAVPYHQMIVSPLLRLRLREKVRVQRNQCENTQMAQFHALTTDIKRYD